PNKADSKNYVILEKPRRNVRRQQIREAATEHKQVTNQDARKCIALLRLDFMQEVHGDNEGRRICELETCADFIQLQSIKRTRQDTFDQCLQRHYLLRSRRTFNT
ncbi:hypothetical protein B7P43_G15244, partial [Cryptotermes secundus]